MRNDSLTKSGYWDQTQLDWVSDWHTKWVAGLTSTKDYPHQVGGETGSLASRWIACSLTKSPRHWEILFATHLVSRGHSPLSQWYHKTSMQNLILKKTQALSDSKPPSFSPHSLSGSRIWIQIGAVTHDKTATSPYRCNPLLLFIFLCLKFSCTTKTRK